MTLKLYDLAGAETDRRFSPYCWRSRMALAHKELPAETIPWRFVEKQALAATGQGKVPVLADGERMIHDSWTIALHLEEQYPDRPSLFGGDMGRGLALLTQNWVNGAVLGALRPVILLHVFNCLEAADKVYFRETREKMLGRTLEEAADESPAQIARFRAALAPARETLSAQRYLCGDGPGYADYILFGAFQWARCTCPTPLLDRDDPVHAWRDRMLNLFDGLAGRAKGYAV